MTLVDIVWLVALVSFVISTMVMATVNHRLREHLRRQRNVIDAVSQAHMNDVQAMQLRVERLEDAVKIPAPLPEGYSKMCPECEEARTGDDFAIGDYICQYCRNAGAP